MKRLPHRTLALLALPAVASAQLTDEYGAKIETIVSAAQVQAVTGTAYVGMTDAAVMAYGDVVFHCYMNPGTHAVLHWEADTGVLTEAFDENQIALTTGLTAGLTVHALDVSPTNGDLWMLVAEGYDPFGGGPYETHLLHATLTGAAPGGWSPLSSLFNYDAEFESDNNLRVNLFGTVDLVVDEGNPFLDLQATAPGSGLYKWFPGFSTVPVMQQPYVALSAAMTNGGPVLAPAGTAHDTGASNMTDGLTRTYLTMASTAENSPPNDDDTAGEAYDGDIVVFDEGSATTTVLIPRKRYLARTNGLFGYTRSRGDDIAGIALAADPFRDRLYTMEIYWDPFVDHYQANSILQWDLTTGTFEKVVVTYDQIRKAWPPGVDQHYYGSGFESPATTFEGGLTLAPDGSLVVAIGAESISGDDRLLRVTPDDL